MGSRRIGDAWESLQRCTLTRDWERLGRCRQRRPGTVLSELGWLGDPGHSFWTGLPVGKKGRIDILGLAHLFLPEPLARHRARSVFGKPETADAADDEQDDGGDQTEDFEGCHCSILPTMRFAMTCSAIRGCWPEMGARIDGCWLRHAGWTRSNGPASRRAGQNDYGTANPSIIPAQWLTARFCTSIRQYS